MTDENKKPESEEPQKPKPVVPPPVPGAPSPAAPNPAVPAPGTPAAPSAAPKPAAAAPAAPKPAIPASAPGAQTAKPVPAAAAAARPAVPARPASPERRQFMITWLGFAWAIFAAATVAALSTVLRYMFPNVLFEPKTAFKIGTPDSYEPGKVDTTWEDKYGVWIVRSPEGIYALSTVCTHLGCKPSWYDAEQKFKCPCHGSGFYKSGINFEGPAPRPLERFAVTLADDGQILVDKSKKFQYEKGEWSNPLSLLVV